MSTLIVSWRYTKVHEISSNPNTNADFQNLVHATTYVNVVGIGCCAFLLLSFAVLPVEYTRRHYLSVCLTFAILLMQVCIHVVWVY